MSFKQRLLQAIGRPKPGLKLPSATEPRAGYMSYTMRLLFGERDDGTPKPPRRDRP